MAEESNEKTFAYYLEKAKEAREQMKLGSMAIKSDYEDFGIIDRIKAKARHFGIGGTGDYGSIYGINEQQALARGDRFGSGVLAASNLGFGVLNFGVGMIGGGPLARLGGYAAMGQFIPGLAGVSSLASNAAFYSNPASLAAMAGLSIAEKSLGETFLNPFVYARQFSGSALHSSRNFVQGIGSETGVGGLSIREATSMGRVTERYRHMFRDIEPEQFENFLKVGQTFAPFGDSKKVGETMGKFLSVMVGLAQQFKGKEHELAQAMQQFAGMGFSVDQAAQSIRTSSRMGTMMNIDPSRIMAAGMGMTQAVAGTGISQYAAYNIGANAFTQVNQMAQLGQFTKTQLFNSGGAEGIAQTIASGQMGLLNSKYADIYLKAIYNRPGQSGTIADPNMIAKVTGGDMTMREAQFRSQATTLSPHSNMAFQFDRDSIISAMGSDAGEFADEMFTAALRRNPYANTPYGKAKLYMTMNPGVSHQQAMQYIQYHSSKNPMYTKALEEMSMDKRLASMDPFYSSENKLGRGMAYLGRGISHAWHHVSRNMYPTVEGSWGRKVWGTTGSFLFGGIEDLNPFYDKLTSNRIIEDYTQPFKGLSVKDVVDMRKNYKPRSKEEQIKKRLASKFLKEDYSDLAEADADLVSTDFVYDVKTAISDSERGSISDPELLEKRTLEITNEILKNNPRFNSDLTTEWGTTRSGREQIEGMVGASLSTKELKESIKSSILSTRKTNLKLRETPIGPALLGTGAWFNGGFGTGMIANSTAWKSLKNTIFGDVSRYNAFSTKWNTSSLDERKRMAKRLEEISKGTSSDSGLTITDKALLGVEYLNSKQIESLLKQEEIKNISSASEQDIKQANYYSGVESLFSTNTYKSVFSAFGNENLGAGIAKEIFLGKGVGQEDLKITEENFRKLKKSHLPGYEDIMSYLTFDKETSSVQVDSERLLKTKDGKQKLENFMQRTGASGEAFERINRSAEEIWRENKMNAASTIQDFAVAVATGIRMAEYAGLDAEQKIDLLGKSNNDQNAAIWNNVKK